MAASFPTRPSGVSPIVRSLEAKPQRREDITAHLRFGTQSREGRMLRTARYKCNAFSKGARPEQLFDLQLDPGESRNLAFEASSAAVLNQHRALFTAELNRTKDNFRTAL